MQQNVYCFVVYTGLTTEQKNLAYDPVISFTEFFILFCNVCVCVCMCGFCNVWVCVCVGFVMCGCVYVWVL